MAHEELKKQFDEDVKQYGADAYKMWEFKSHINPKWQGCDPCGPKWYGHHKYRRKEPPFEPKYYSGLNWRDAPIGEKLCYSDDGEGWTKTASQLRAVFKPGGNKEYRPFQSLSGLRWYFAKTCPETNTHPTITLTVNGREWVLPKPETEAPAMDTVYWFISEHNELRHRLWDGCIYDGNMLQRGKVHLTESRAQAWVDFWREAILGELK